MSSPTPSTDTLPTTRRAFRRTDDFNPGHPKLTLTTEPLPPLGPISLLIRIHTISLNYRDANTAYGHNPWPVLPRGIPCNDAAGTILATGPQVRSLKVGDRVMPIIDTANLTGRETGRSWLAADEDGVCADYVVCEEGVVGKVPEGLGWREACLVPCAGVTAWCALKGMRVGQTVLVQGTGGVAMFSLKLARAAGLRVILTSSDDEKLARIGRQYPDPPLLMINYRKNPNWHEEVLRLTDGAGVDIVIEVGGSSTLVQSMKCTCRGGIVSQVGYLSKQDPMQFKDLLSVIIDRRVILRGINAGSKQDLDDLNSALATAKIQLDDLIDSTYPFEKAEEAIEYVWQGKQVGKVVLTVDLTRPA